MNDENLRGARREAGAAGDKYDNHKTKVEAVAAAKWSHMYVIYVYTAIPYFNVMPPNKPGG